MPRALALCLLPLLLHAADPGAARKLLESVPEMVSATHPETGVVVLFRAGMVWGAIDKKAGLDLLNRAFSTAPSVTSESARLQYQAEIVKATAALDAAGAGEMLRQMPKPASAATAVVVQLLATKQVDQAMEVLAMIPDSAEYPFEAASHLIARLPEGDPTRTVAFGRAIQAFGKNPEGPFPQLVERFGKQVSADLLSQALTAMIRRIEAWKDNTDSFAGGPSDESKEMEYHSPRQTELRELVSVLRLFDQKAADRILTARPDLKAVLDGFRSKRKAAEPIDTKDKPSSSMGDDEDDDELAPPLGLGTAKDLEEMGRRIEQNAKLEKQVKKVFEALKKDPVEAAKLARKLPDHARVQLLARIAEQVSEKDAASGRAQLEACESGISELADPADRVLPRMIIGKSYAKLKDVPNAMAAFRKALADVAPLYSADTRADRPNVAPRDTWPSVQSCRVVVHHAAATLGAQAEALLSEIQVADLAVVARVQMARALLGLDADIHAITVAWSSPN